MAAEFDKEAPIWHVRFPQEVPLGPDDTGRMRYGSLVPEYNPDEASGYPFAVAARHASFVGGNVEAHLPISNPSSQG